MLSITPGMIIVGTGARQTSGRNDANMLGEGGGEKESEREKRGVQTYLRSYNYIFT